MALLAGCNRGAETPAASSTSAAKAENAKITQFYASEPAVAKGEKSLLCYGVENAKTVWMTPPRTELTASPSRCVEVTPTSTTTYKLTAEGASGPAATQDVTVTIGPAHVKIVEVKVSSLEVKKGDQVSICYQVQNAKSVEIAPVHFEGGARPNACVMASPQQATTYVVTATGASGDRDSERVTVKVH
jgi:hypothetical protein